MATLFAAAIAAELPPYGPAAPTYPQAAYPTPAPVAYQPKPAYEKPAYEKPVEEYHVSKIRFAILLRLMENDNKVTFYLFVGPDAIQLRLRS